MQIEFMSDRKNFSDDLINKSKQLVYALAKLLFEVEIFEYLESYRINLDTTLSSVIPETEQDLFVQEVKKSTNTQISMFFWRKEEVDSILVSLDLTKISRGYSTVVTPLGKYIWTITSEEITFEKIN